MENNIIILKDSYVYRKVSNELAAYLWKGNMIELFVLDMDKEVESLINNLGKLISAIMEDAVIAIEVGHLNDTHLGD